MQPRNVITPIAINKTRYPFEEGNPSAGPGNPFAKAKMIIGITIEPAPDPPNSAMFTSDARKPRCLPFRVDIGTNALFAVLYSGNATA